MRRKQGECDETLKATGPNAGQVDGNRSTAVGFKAQRLFRILCRDLWYSRGGCRTGPLYIGGVPERRCCVSARKATGKRYYPIVIQRSRNEPIARSTQDIDLWRRSRKDLNSNTVGSSIRRLSREQKASTSSSRGTKCESEAPILPSHDIEIVGGGLLPARARSSKSVGNSTAATTSPLAAAR